MTYPSYLRERAREMRTKEKLSVVEIADRLAIAKSTAFGWVGDIPLGRPRRENGHPGNVAMCRKYRLIREAAYATGRDEFDDLAQIDGFRDFVSLYIAEGYKRNRNTVSVANSDPAVIVFCASWVRRYSEKRLQCSIQFHADQNPDQLRRFWGDKLKVEPGAISLQRKSNSSQLEYRKWRSKHGVMSVRVGDTAFRARLQGWIDRLQERWLIEARLAALGA
jgi:hypothetical protein